MIPDLSDKVLNSHPLVNCWTAYQNVSCSRIYDKLVGSEEKFCVQYSGFVRHKAVLIAVEKQSFPFSSGTMRMLNEANRDILKIFYAPSPLGAKCHNRKKFGVLTRRVAPAAGRRHSPRKLRFQREGRQPPPTFTRLVSAFRQPPAEPILVLQKSNSDGPRQLPLALLAKTKMKTEVM